MNIFLEAFVDTNFGDNLFVHTVVSRYPQHTFYMLPKSGYESSYQILLEQEPNIQLISKEEQDAFLHNMDGMLVVGGDMFWEGTYRTWQTYIKAIKKKGGPVIFLGMSLFPTYSRKTRFFLKRLLHQVDVIVVRESQSYEQLKQIAPKANAIAATDIAFTTDVSNIKKEEVEQGVLGISVRKKIPRHTSDAYEQYCKCMAETVTTYLKADKNHKVRFLALSKGVFDDEVVARKIANLCPLDCQDQIGFVSFTGNVTAYIYEMQRCEKLVCTRFHALVYAILLQKPFLPIVYEEKTRRLLQEIGYEGLHPEYEEYWNGEALIQSYGHNQLDEKKTDSYLCRSEQVFRMADQLLNK